MNVVCILALLQSVIKTATFEFKIETHFQIRQVNRNPIGFVFSVPLAIFISYCMFPFFSSLIECQNKRQERGRAMGEERGSCDINCPYIVT